MAGKVTSLEGKIPKAPPPLQVVSLDGASSMFFGPRAERYNPDQLAARKGGLGIYKRMLQDEQVKAVMKFRRDSIIGRGHEFVFGETELSDDEQKKRTYVMCETVARMNGSFADAVSGVLTGMAYGFSLSEFVTQIIKVEGSPYVGLADILTRDPETFKFYTDDYGTLTRLTQDVNGREIELDPVKFIHYVQNPDIDPYYGESELRAAYRAWFMKDMDIKLWAAYKERMAGGFLAIQLGASGIVPNSPDYTELQAALKNMRSTMGIMLPNGVTAEMHIPASTDVFEKALTVHDLAIAKSLLVPNLLGMSQAGQTGSYSQSQTQLETYFMTLATDTQRLEQCLNDQLFRVLAQQNWDDGEFPRFRFKKASAEHVKWVVDSVVALSGAGGLILTPKDEAHLRQLLDLAPRDEAEEALAKVKQDMVPIQEDPNKLAAIAAKGAAAKGKAAFSEWDESKHPRHAAGDDRGGEFAPKSEQEKRYAKAVEDGAPVFDGADQLDHYQDTAAPNDVASYWKDVPPVKGVSGAWGHSHSLSRAMTADSAAKLGIPGYESKMQLYPEQQKEVDTFLGAIASSKGSPEQLVHSFADVKNIQFKPGDTMRLPLTATSGERIEMAQSYGVALDAENQRGVPTFFVFEKGTPAATYSRWNKSDAVDFNHAQSEALVAGEFQVVSVHKWTSRGYQHDSAKGKAYNTIHKVVTLRATGRKPLGGGDG